MSSETTNEAMVRSIQGALRNPPKPCDCPTCVRCSLSRLSDRMLRCATHRVTFSEHCPPSTCALATAPGETPEERPARPEPS